MLLRITRAYKQHFRPYFFEATNDLGKEVYTVELVRRGERGNLSLIHQKCENMLLYFQLHLPHHRHQLRELPPHWSSSQHSYSAAYNEQQSLSPLPTATLKPPRS
jgi:hypothetical protein